MKKNVLNFLRAMTVTIVIYFDTADLFLLLLVLVSFLKKKLVNFCVQTPVAAGILAPF